MENKPIIDLDTLEEVPPREEVKEVESKAADEGAAEKEEEKKEPEESDDAKETKEEEKEEAPTEEEEEETKDEPEAKKEEEKAEEPVAIDDFLKGEYEEKYEIKSKEELDATLENLSGLLEINEELMAKNKELTEQLAAKPKDELTETQKSIFKLVKDLDPSNISSGIMTWARLSGMDVAKEPAKLVLEEQFILENMELSREDAQRKFARDYNKKYGTPNREDFDNDQAFNEEKEDREIDLMADAAKARKFLLEKQKEYKTKETPTETKKEEVAPVVTTAIKQMGTELDKYMKNFSEIVYKPSDKHDNIVFALSKEQKAEVFKVMKAWTENPASYDDKGKFAGGPIATSVIDVAFAQFGTEILDTVFKAAINLGEIKKADVLAKRQPDRKAKAAGDNPVGKMTEDQQWEAIAKKKAAERASRGR